MSHGTSATSPSVGYGPYWSTDQEILRTFHLLADPGGTALVFAPATRGLGEIVDQIKS